MNGLFQVTHRAVVISSAGLGFTQAVGGHIVRGIQIDRLLQGGHCGFVLFEAVIRLTQLGVIFGVAPLTLYQGIQGVDHFFPGTLGLVYPDHDPVGSLMSGGQLKRLLSRLDGLPVLPLAGINMAQIAEGIHVLRVLLQGFPEQVLGPVVFPIHGLLNALLVNFAGISGDQVIH